MNSLLNLFLIFFKIGLFTFGGGLAMMPLIRQEVINNNFMSIDELIDFIAISESTPGSLAVNMSTYVGYNTNGLLGALCATLGVILPSFIIILFISKAYDSFKENKYIKQVMINLKPVIVGLIASTFISLSITVLFNDLPINNLDIDKFIISICIFIICMIFIKIKKSPILVIVLSGLIGIILGLVGII